MELINLMKLINIDIDKYFHTGDGIIKIPQGPGPHGPDFD